MKSLPLFVLLSTLAFSQTPDPRTNPTLLSFEVASIRRSEIWKSGAEGGSRSRFEYSPGGIRLLNVDLSDCLQWAYDVRFYQIAGRKSLNAERYDIVAKVENRASLNQLRLMMQDLLASRFQVRLHREMRTLPVYELVTTKSGPKLPARKTDDSASPSHSQESLPRVENGDFIFPNTTIVEFADKLSQLRGIDRPVLDRTGIQGTFDITLKSGAAALIDPNGPSLLTLLQEQLGLKLAAAKAPVDTLVIDRAEPPSQN